MNAQPKRRWGRYSLRTLFILVALASLGFGWLGYKVRQAQRQKEAVEAIEKLGGAVMYDFQFDSNGKFNGKATPPGPAWLRKLLGDHLFVNVVRVELFGNTQVTDGDLVHLQELEKLETLNLSITQVTDAGLVHLEGLNQLRELNLSDTQVTDAELFHLQGLDQLERLYLSITPVTDAGLVHLRGLNQLRDLVLSDTQVTDNGLFQLQGLKKLKYLSLEHSHVTDKGCQELQKALPNLEIRR